MDPVTGLSLGRIGLGIGALVAPDRTAELLGLDSAANPQLSVYGRMFGAREVALGAITLVAGGALRRNLTLVGMAVDGADVAAAVSALRSRTMPTASAGSFAAVAAGAVGAGFFSLRRSPR
ncbi:hypothetical protein JK386_03745 [Nocardioides sp. zg-536]|uniref:DUF4267 domain-containing protein n=1 Tax=Nocardioides faecalis TaxID=2803858 RepID=A0A938Y863_9ACTN|nr:hypothetical protein [Nocardioides faecalis]MBM9459004.1 hypothetical protein [Nocardioides faecalis]MBS4753894.1 hypothetical protein [Nocardioides faecalis]QVI57272.1 hypothetical protein KG111_09005 [Nocardioides faecalis]